MIAGGFVGYWTVWKTLRTDVFPDKQQTQMEATTRPDIAPRLSLVVLPFANLNSDPEQDYFADGITTDLTTDLARMPGAFVIGRGTAFTYKNKQIDFRTLGKDLGIRWAVQGAVRRSGDQVRVNVSLTDIASGRDVWSDLTCHCVFPPDGVRVRPAEGRTDGASKIFGRADYRSVEGA
ncbi:hypothetical protein [Bradyrhizobium sp. Leo121]|uniref:hypothetical protein n=1 Tax=Bradyrhizobium sp. Leo121 TaxID=1571195 RepID=UPI001FE166FD|nr:hypothetical protein [Bradyrhizobium sp. Leo121]